MGVVLQHLLIFVSSLHLLSPCSLAHVPPLRVWALPHTPQVWTPLHTSYSSLTQLGAGPHFLWLTLWLTLLRSTSFSHLYPVQYIRACTVDSALSLSSSISRPKRLSSLCATPSFLNLSLHKHILRFSPYFTATTLYCLIGKPRLARHSPLPHLDIWSTLKRNIWLLFFQILV